MQGNVQCISFFLACHILAEFYMTVENDAAKGKELYENTCKELHFYDSCLALGNIYLTHKSKESLAAIFQKHLIMFGSVIRG